MAQPVEYARQYNFTNYQTQYPSDPLPANQVDAEFNAVKTTTDQIRTNLALIQRDDGELANGSVGVDQLDSSISLGFTAPTAWQTLTNYVVLNSVFNEGKLYRCLVSHTSGTFATDLAASKWTLVADFSATLNSAVNITFTPAGSIAATNVQAAIEEVASEALNTNLTVTETAVASAATCDIGGAATLRVEVTGTTTITSLGTAQNKVRLVRFSGALTLTHNGTTLILPGGGNIVTQAGDTGVFSSDGSGNWRCLSYQRGAGVPQATTEVAVASAATCDIGASGSSRVNVTGTTTITSLGTSKNREILVRFSAALTLTHDGTALILLGGSNIVTAAGDIGLFTSDASGNWRLNAWFPGDYAAGGLAEASVASAATCDIGATATERVQVTGTTTITSFGTSKYRKRLVRFAAALTLTHNATTLILPGSKNILTAAGDVGLFVSDGSSNWRCMFYTRGDGVPYPRGRHGECQLTYSAGNLLLSPFNGNQLVIDGVSQTIPSAGVVLTPSGATPNSNYWIYAYMSSGTMTLEYSGTAPAWDTTTGVRIKNGDSSRTLVGLARAITGPNWGDTTDKRFVLSYFNRRALSIMGVSASPTTTSLSFVELSGTRTEFLTWADDAVWLRLTAYPNNNTGGHTCLTQANIDGSGSGGTVLAYSPTAGYAYGHCTGTVGLLSEGYHYAAVNGAVSAGTGTFSGALVTGSVNG